MMITEDDFDKNDGKCRRLQNELILLNFMDMFSIRKVKSNFCSFVSIPLN